MFEFKLNYYFELYKDASIISTTRFKENFIKKHGEFPLLSELIIMIWKYQQDRYGELVQNGKKLTRYVKHGTYQKQEIQRIQKRFGNREERLRRKLDEKWRVQ